jgi:hypothetical protein
VRRARTEQLMLVSSQGKSVTLFTVTRDPGELTTQDIFQVSPDGAYLAYAADGSLHLRTADGSERTFDGYTGLMRFSPDARYLAIVTGEHVRLVDLPSGATRELGTSSSIRQLEWLRDAVVVETSDALLELPLAGPQTTLLEHASLERFVAAGTGTRVVAFVREPETTRILALDGGTRRDLGTVDEPTTNAAATLDGTHVAFSTYAAVFTIDGDAGPELLARQPAVHSLWYARDGRLGYASYAVATIGSQHAIGDVHMLRFDPLTGDALVARGDRLGLDHFAGGYVEWTLKDRQ